jgi:hypothetical protein
MGEKYFIDNAKHKGFEMTHSISEFVDNSIDAGAKNVYISKELQKNGQYTLTIQDDGSGIPQDKMVECFKIYGYNRQYANKGISAFGQGSRDAMSFLVENGTCEVISNHNGEQSSINIGFKYGYCGISKAPYVVPTKEPNGTTIIIPNVTMTQRDHLKLVDWLAFIYFPHYQKDNNFKIFVSTKQKIKDEIYEVKFVDVLYRNIWEYNSNAVELHRDKNYRVAGETINLKAYIFNQEVFDKEALYTNFDKSNVKRGGSFSFDKAGIYWKLGSRYSNFGKGYFISMTNQHSLNNVRLEIDISGPTLMKLFKVNVNKSKISVPKDVENHPELKSFFDDVRLLIRSIVQSVRETSKMQISEKQRTERDVLNEMANQNGDFTGLKQSLKDLKPRLQNGEADSKTDKPEITYEASLVGFAQFCKDNGYEGITKLVDEDKYSINDILYHHKNETFMKIRGGGWTQDRDAYRLDIIPISKWAPFMDVPTLYGNKYIYTINTLHPYYEEYAKLSIDAKYHINTWLISMMSTLIKTDFELEDDGFTNKFVETLNVMLVNWVKTNAKVRETAVANDTDLDLD